ncbi:MAG: GNAT family N-acetyltransferase [Ferruginibacter sp.]
MAATIRIIRTDSSDKNFQELVVQLDKDLAIRDGDEHAFYHQFNKITNLNQVIVAYENDEAVGCGAIKAFTGDAMEVKRMFVPVAKRGSGIASLILSALEKWAKELGNKKCVLETGKKQPEAIALYQKNGYKQIPNYGQYEGKDNSLCFEKAL